MVLHGDETGNVEVPGNLNSQFQWEQSRWKPEGG